MTTPPMISPNKGDSRRDAEKFARLVIALRKATEAIQALENGAEPNVDDILTRLLPDLANALDVRHAFIARTAVSNGDLPAAVELVAVHPDWAPASPHLPMTALLTALLQDGKPRVITPLGDDPPTLIAGLEIFDATSAILVRVATTRQLFIVGFCNKEHVSEEPFLAVDGMTLNNVLGLIAMGARVGERRQSELHGLQTVIAAISNEINLEELQPLIVRQAADVFRADAVSLMLWDERRAYLRIAQGVGLSDQYTQQQRISEEVVTARLAEAPDQRLHYMADLVETPLGDPDLIEKEGVRSVLSTTLRVPGTLIGVLNIYSKGEIRRFSAGERELALLFGDEAAIAVKNARAYQRRLDELKAIREISEMAIQDDVERVWRTIAEKAVALTGADMAMLMAAERYTKRLASVGAWDAVHNRWVPQVNDTLAFDAASINGYVALTQEPQYLPDVTNPPAQFRHGPVSELPGAPIRSAYCVPLVAQGETLGTLYVARIFGNGIDEESRRFVLSLAPHAAIALTNMRLVDDANREKDRRTKLIEMQQKVIRIQQSTVDVLSWDQQIEQVRKELAVELDVSGFFIATYDERSKRIELAKVYEDDTLVRDADPRRQPGGIYGPRKLQARHGLVDHVIDKRQPLLVSDFENDPLWVEIDPVYKQGIRSFLVVPLKIGDQIKGVMGLRNYRSPYAYDAYDQRLLESVADHVATVLENARQYDRRVRELQAVSEFQQKISEIDVGNDHEAAVLDSAAPQSVVEREIRNIYVHARAAMSRVDMYTEDMYIALYEPAGRRLTFPLVYDEGKALAPELIESDDRYEAYRDRALGSFPDLTDHLVTTGARAALLFARRSDMEQWARDNNLSTLRLPKRSKTWLAAPMAIGETLIGVIGLRHFREEHIFDERHKSLLETIASQAAIVIDNARLYEDSRARLEELGRSNAVALMAAWGADVVHEINREVGAIRRSLLILRDCLEPAPHPSGDIGGIIDAIDAHVDEMSSPEWLEEPLSLVGVVDPKYTAQVDRVLAQEIARMEERHPTVHFSFVGGCAESRVLIHEKWLRRIVRHLLNNGVSSIAPDAVRREIVVNSVLINGAAQIAFRDSGKGVRSEIRNQLFKRPIDHRPNDKRERSGRGLLLVQTVLSAHTGRIWLDESVEGEGSCFKIELPVAGRVGDPPPDGRAEE